MKRAILVGSLLLLSAGLAWAQTYSGDTDAVTNQGVGDVFGEKLCDTNGNLPAGVFSQVSNNSSFEPCSQAEALDQGSAGEVCDSTYNNGPNPPSHWAAQGHGHLTFGPPSSGTTATQVEVQYWAGQDISSCTGGATVTCTGGSLFEDSTFPFGTLNVSVPFDWGGTGSNAPNDPSHPVQFYLFAKPIGGSIRCTINNIATEENNQGNPTPTPNASATPTPTPTPNPTPTLDVTNAVTHQGGVTGKPCDTTGNLTANTYSQLSSDNAGQPCTEGINNVLCDTNSKWNYTVHGHLTLTPPTSGTTASTVEVQTYIGGNLFSCTHGTTITCTGSYVLVEDSTYDMGSTTLSIPFDMGEYLLAPHDSGGGANFQEFVVFAKPIGGSLQCLSNLFTTTEHN